MLLQTIFEKVCASLQAQSFKRYDVFTTSQRRLPEAKSLTTSLHAKQKSRGKPRRREERETGRVKEEKEEEEEEREEEKE